MIRVLFIHDTLVCGGAEQALLDLLCLLDKSVFDVTVFVINDGGEWEQRFRDAGIRIISSYSGLVNSRDPFLRLGNMVRRKRIDKARRRGGKNLVKISHPKERFDIVVSYSVWRLQATGIFPGAKLIKFIHGDVVTNAYYGGIMEKSKALLSRFDRFICVSAQAADSFKRRIGFSDKTTVCLNPVNCEKIITRAQAQDSQIPQGKYICAVGRLSADKGFSRLVKIHRRLLEEGFEHKLVIVGEGPDRPNLEKAIQETQTQKTVILMGQKDNPYPVMLNSLLTVCASYTEGLPVVSVESLVLGVPVVAAVPSVGELFDGETCGIITGNDDDSLEAGIRRMLSDEQFYRAAKEGAVARGRALDGTVTVKAIENEFLNVVFK